MFFEIALIGTTASGKTAIANTLAYKYDAVILSLDSLCVYKEINIANAKCDLNILNELKYFGVNLLSIQEHFNVELFIKEYQKAKQYAQSKNKALIIVGGTSFYLKTMMDGLSEKIKEDKILLSNDEIYAMMLKIDPEFKIEKNDTYRLHKWINIYQNTKQIPSIFLKNTKKESIIKNIEIYELVWDKEILKQNIKKRTREMLNNGLIEEAKYLFSNFNTDLKALNSIGLKECKSYLNKEINIKELEELINIHTTQLAKRQRTFNKKFQKISLEFSNAVEKLDHLFAK